MYVGRLHKKKNVHNLIKNLPCSYEGTSIELTIAGYSDDSAYLEYLFSLANYSNIEIRILLDIADAEKSHLYLTHDFFISLSQIENFGISVFEALSSGLPSIVHSDTDFWPVSGFPNIFSVPDFNLEDALSMVKNVCLSTSQRQRAEVFEDKWNLLQTKIQRDILNLIYEQI